MLSINGKSLTQLKKKKTMWIQHQYAVHYVTINKV